MKRETARRIGCLGVSALPGVCVCAALSALSIRFLLSGIEGIQRGGWDWSFEQVLQFVGASLILLLFHLGAFAFLLGLAEAVSRFFRLRYDKENSLLDSAEGLGMNPFLAVTAVSWISICVLSWVFYFLGWP